MQPIMPLSILYLASRKALQTGWLLWQNPSGKVTFCMSLPCVPFRGTKGRPPAMPDAGCHVVVGQPGGWTWRRAHGCKERSSAGFMTYDLTRGSQQTPTGVNCLLRGMGGRKKQ